jgi:uncharacterized protein YdcH (DUF465 family)
MDTPLDETTAIGRRAIDAQRFERLEDNYENLEKAVNSLAVTVNTVKGDQEHLEKMFELRFKIQDKILEDQTEKLQRLLVMVEGLIMNPEQTAGGRGVQAAITMLSNDIVNVKRDAVAGVKECNAEIDKLKASDLKDLHDWKHGVNTVIGFLRWIGIPSLVLFVLFVIMRVAAIFKGLMP